MKVDIKRKWVEALRSGKYKQTTNTLRYIDNSAFCCLGVLCEIHPGVRRHKNDSNCYSYKGGSLSGELNVELLEKIDMSDEQQQKLINFNDTEKWSFKKIAAYVERYL